MKAILFSLILVYLLKPFEYQEQYGTSIKKLIPKDTTETYIFSVIKKYESFRPDIYTLFGHKTIGYGHVLHQADTLYYLNEKTAYIVLKSDFQKMVKKARVLCPKSKKEHYYLIACLLFNCKHKGIINSDLVKMINNQAPDETIRNEFLKFHFINGKSHKRLYKRRIDESKIL